jgi:hypothetical protein
MKVCVVLDIEATGIRPTRQLSASFERQFPESQEKNARAQLVRFL